MGALSTNRWWGSAALTPAGATCVWLLRQRAACWAALHLASSQAPGTKSCPAVSVQNMQSAACISRMRQAAGAHLPLMCQCFAACSCQFLAALLVHGTCRSAAICFCLLECARAA